VSAAFQVGPETFVTLSVAVRDAEGEALIEPEVSAFVFGMGQINQEIEQALEGRVSGENFQVQLKPEQAFGVRDPERILTLGREEFPPGIAEGDVFDLEDIQGNLIVAHVLHVDDETVVLDTNHPFADQKVTFEISVVDVRPATDRELRAAEAEIAELEAPPPDVHLGSLIRRPSQG
jgi:FKBP-type peptidyl-prolyl cis-trans isomerase SlyD